jgi:hypothetical protein
MDNLVSETVQFGFELPTDVLGGKECGVGLNPIGLGSAEPFEFVLWGVDGEDVGSVEFVMMEPPDGVDGLRTAAFVVVGDVLLVDGSQGEVP